MMQRDALRYAARSWFIGRFCQPDRRLGNVQTPSPDIELGVEDLRGYLLDGRLPKESAAEALSWQIRVTRLGAAPPHLHALWLPPPGESTAALSRRTGAFCDSDGDLTSEERCDDAGNGTPRLVWSELLVQPTLRGVANAADVGVATPQPRHRVRHQWPGSGRGWHAGSGWEARSALRQGRRRGGLVHF